MLSDTNNESRLLHDPEQIATKSGLAELKGMSFVSFRLSSHSLPIETGRHHRPPIPRPSRLFTHCPLSSVGDEHHFVFVIECPYFQPLRDRYDTLFSPQTISMRSFFAQKDRMNVFKFISGCLDMMNTQS